MIAGTPTSVWDIERIVEVYCELPSYSRPRLHPFVTLSAPCENGLISSMLGSSRGTTYSTKSNQGPPRCLTLCQYIVSLPCNTIWDQQTGYGALTTRYSDNAVRTHKNTMFSHRNMSISVVSMTETIALLSLTNIVTGLHPKPF